MFREYQRTGYVWEQYDDKDGSGKVCAYVCVSVRRRARLCLFVYVCQTKREEKVEFR